jgi:hypothetical protein
MQEVSKQTENRTQVSTAILSLRWGGTIHAANWPKLSNSKSIAIQSIVKRAPLFVSILNLDNGIPPWPRSHSEVDDNHCVVLLGFCLLHAIEPRQFYLMSSFIILDISDRFSYIPLLSNPASHQSLNHDHDAFLNATTRRAPI